MGRILGGLIALAIMGCGEGRSELRDAGPELVEEPCEDCVVQCGGGLLECYTADGDLVAPGTADWKVPGGFRCDDGFAYAPDCADEPRCECVLLVEERIGDGG